MGSLNQALAFLVDTVVHLYMVALMLRLLLELNRADFYNPAVQFLVQITNPIIQPMARLLPRSTKINIAGWLVLYLIQLGSLIALSALTHQHHDIGLLLMLSVMRLLRMLLNTYIWLIIISVILSWVGQNLRHPMIPLVYRLVDPVLTPIRRLLPSMGGLDLSPLIAIIGIQFLMILLGI